VSLIADLREQAVSANVAVEETVVRDAEVIERFLASDAIRRAFDRARSGFVEDWKGAKTRDTREECHARLLAVERVWDALNAAIGDGQKAKHEKERRERSEEAHRRRGQG
jgi:hypothetical protein